jgi:uncharacterized protein
MSDTLSLYRLQQLDLRLAQVEARLKTIQDTLENNQLIAETKKKLDNTKGELHNKEKTIKTTDQLIQEQRIKIDQIESSLYGGSVRNPKELQDLQNDAIYLKHALSTMEEQELDEMIALENLQAVYNASMEEYGKILAKMEESNQTLGTEKEALQKDAKRLLMERQATTQSIDPEAIALYEKIRGERHGIAVTTISDNSCDSCGSVLTPAQQQAAHHSHQLFRCPSCGRIIYS